MNKLAYYTVEALRCTTCGEIMDESAPRPATTMWLMPFGPNEAKARTAIEAHFATTQHTTYDIIQSVRVQEVSSADHP